MIIGVPKEIKDKEFRVGIVPAGVKTLCNAGHQVIIEQGAGRGSDISDQEFEKAGDISATTCHQGKEIEQDIRTFVVPDHLNMGGLIGINP